MGKRNVSSDPTAFLINPIILVDLEILYNNICSPAYPHSAEGFTI